MSVVHESGTACDNNRTHTHTQARTALSSRYTNIVDVSEAPLFAEMWHVKKYCKVH